MDLDDIDKWSRELLQKEAGKRGYINASMYSRPELIRLILRHDYASAKDAREAAFSLFQKAKSALKLGLDVAAHAARSRTRGEALPPGPFTPWEPAAREPAGARPAAEPAAVQRDATFEVGGGPEQDSAGAAVATEDAEQATGLAPEPAMHAGAETPAASEAAAAAGPDRASDDPAPRAPARSMFPPPPTAESTPEPSLAATSTKQQTHVDPTPELRPPAISGAKGEAPPPLELQAALTSAQLSAADTPIVEPRAASVRVDPTPELRPPAKSDFVPNDVSLKGGPQSGIVQTEYGSSPWSIRPVAPKPAAPAGAVAFEQAPPPPAAEAAKGADQLSYGPRTEHGLLLRWQVSSDGVERARSVLGSQGELAVRIVAVRTDDHAVVHTEIFDHGPIESRGDWTAPLPPNAARYVSAVGLRTPERFVSIVHTSS